jgi:transcriptional regulator with XRE-family HTH domain
MGSGLNSTLIRARRVAAGLTIYALADRVGVHAGVLWAIEDGDERRVAHFSLATLLALAASLDLRPGDLFIDQDHGATPPTPDDVALEAALLLQGATVTREQLALAFSWPLARLDQALAALHQRLRPTGARLHPVGIDRYVIASNRNALPADQWVQLGQARSGHAPLTVDAATTLYHLIALRARFPPPHVRHRSAARNPWQTAEWDAADEGLRQLREQGLLDAEGPHFSASPDVRYSLGLDA